MPGRQRAAGTVRVCGQSEEVACRSDLRGVGSRHRTAELENQGSRATSPASPCRGDLTVATCSIMAPRRSSKPSMAYGARSRRPASGAAEVSVPRYAPGAESDWELESGCMEFRAGWPQGALTPRMRMKLAHSAGLVAGPGQRSCSLRSNGMIRVGPSSWRWCGKSARGTLLVSPEPIGLAALLYSKNCASFVHRSMVVSSRVVVDVVTSPLSSQTRRRTDRRQVRPGPRRGSSGAGLVEFTAVPRQSIAVT